MMSLRGCFGCLKFLVFVVNFLFWLFGLGVMAVSLWLLFDQQLYLQSIGAHQTDYYIGTYIILGIGGIMTLVGFLGCCGAWKESTWMLGTFFILLIFIFIGEIAVGALIYLQEAPYQDVISRSVEATVKRKYHHNSTATTQTFDLIQEGLRCCGHHEPLDWARSVYNGHSKDQVREIGIPHNSNTPTDYGITSFNIPESCCKLPSTQDCYAAVTKVEPGQIPSDKIYTKVHSNRHSNMQSQNDNHLSHIDGSVASITKTCYPPSTQDLLRFLIEEECGAFEFSREDPHVIDRICKSIFVNPIYNLHEGYRFES